MAYRVSTCYLLKIMAGILGLLIIAVLNIRFTNEIGKTLPVASRRYSVYIKPKERLGNLLYKLASAYGLARTNKRSLVLDPKYIRGISRLLDVSLLPVSVATVPENLHFAYFTNKYEPEKEHLEQRDLMVGPYIQARQYFQPYETEIREMFVINEALVKSIQKYLHSLILPPESVLVSIHVRRGDFLDQHNVHDGRLVPQHTYLKKAMTYFLSKYNNVHFIICSDDIDGCRNNETYLQPGKLRSIADYGLHLSPGDRAEWDMALLAQCNHSIVTVGTFGWWGAWLAGGEVVYFNHPHVEGSKMDKAHNLTDYFWPTWIGMDDDLKV